MIQDQFNGEKFKEACQKVVLALNNISLALNKLQNKKLNPKSDFHK
tara:strand:+ start:3062 stop:3199 length:138 start_codon:yes stop_codon:yes gene_type:complete